MALAQVMAMFPTAPPIDTSPRLTGLERANILAVLAERASRRRESLRLYHPTPVQEEFHASRAGVRLGRGGNRGGKTLVGAVEGARAWTNQDPHKKYPAKGRAIVVGKDLIHCSKVMYRKLFKPGAFKVIKDEVTGEWKTFDPIMDHDRESECRDSEPLVPARFYDSKRDISWEDKKEEIPKTIRLRTGWEITFFSGEGEPPQGWDVDYIWFDEEIPHSKWFTEMLPRLYDRNGVLIWTATPQAGTVQLYELHSKAEDQAGDPNARVTEHFMNIFTNPYLTEKAKADFIADFADDEEETRVRVYGDFAVAGMRVYPELELEKAHRFPSQVIPSDWTRYAAIDPGRQVAAVLFAAVPPPGNEYYGHVVFYDEVYLKKSNANLLAQAIKAHVGDHHIHGWLIDHNEGRKVETASGRSIEIQYAEEFVKAGLAQNGFREFIWASDDVDAGILAFRSGLHIHEGRSRWLFDDTKLRAFKWECSRYVYQKIAKTGLVTDKPLKRHDHLMDCARYMAMHPLRYVRPPKTRSAKTWIHARLEAKRKKLKPTGGWGDSIRLG